MRLMSLAVTYWKGTGPIFLEKEESCLCDAFIIMRCAQDGMERDMLMTIERTAAILFSAFAEHPSGGSGERYLIRSPCSWR